ncbi:MAG TPA: TonB-dependent receptor [Prolixibacteraceae bacterium]|nr:TonB-dependent receptor [Prolixibacteraceae bacterium]
MRIKQHTGIRKNSQRIFIYLLFTLLLLPAAYAQKRTISGTVKDATGETLVGVNIVIKGSSVGTATDIDGNYTLEVSNNNDVLVANYIGYIPSEITIGNQTLINFVLEKDIQDLDEVVVVGYGVQKKKLVTGATTQLKNEDFVKNNVVQLESAMQGLTPGMLIVKQSGQPGSDFNITIRGLSSINGNSPLVLIDGVPGSFSMVNPSDVESVDVLKDAASAAIYGSRAANGVVLITTKKGTKGEPVISYDAYYGVSNIYKTVDVLNARQYAEIMNEASFNSKPSRALPFTDEYIESLGEGTNWQQEALNENAPSQSHYLGINGGNDMSTYSISFSYASEEGIFDYDGKSKYQKLGFRINSEHQLKPYLKIGENLTYSHRERRAMGTGNIYNNFIHDLLQSNPLFDAYDEGSYDGFGRSNFYDEQINPVASMHYNFNGTNKTDDLIGNVYAEVEIAKGLKFRSDFGGTLNFGYNYSHRDTFTLTPYTYSSIPSYSQGMSRNFYYNFDNVLSYQTTIDKHSIEGIIGMNAQDGRYFNVNGSREGYLSNVAPVINNVTTNIDTTYIYGDYGEGDSRFSYFARASYNYNEKYMATVSIRRDGSSRFGRDKRYGYFPSASAGWVITQEDFMKDVAGLNFLKIRASWGQNGKEPADQFVYMARVGSENRYYTFGGEREVGVSPIIFANPTLKWEASTQANIGFDSRFMEWFRFTFDIYKKESKDWIMQTPVPGISGIDGISSSNPYINGGNVVNSGIELELGYQKSFGEFSIDMAANFAYNKNMVTEVPDSIIMGSASVLYNGSDEFYRVQEGMPMGFFWGYVTDGIFQTQEDIDNHVGPDGVKKLQATAKPGDVKRLDLNNDGLMNDKDKTMIGDPNPDYIYGFRLNMAYKGFDLSMNVQGQGGNQIVQSYRSQERFFNNYTTEILDRWQWTDANNNNVVDAGEGNGNRIPRVTLNDESNQNWRKFSDLYIHDGDFVKIKSVNLGYNFKTSVFKNTPIKQFRVYVAASNLLTITKYNGLDPEIGYGSYYDSEGKLRDAYASGIDVGFYPSPRTYLIGVNVKF